MTQPSVGVALLGTGLLGTAMARRLLERGVALTVWNRDPAKAQPLVELGARTAGSPAEAARAAGVVCLCVTNAEAVEDVVFGAAGVVSAGPLDGPRLIVDFSTIGPDATRRLAERARAAGPFAWLDAPVSGGPGGAATGELIIFCGGTIGNIDCARPVLDALAKRVTRVGELGAGQTMKLCNQLIVSAGLLAIAEAIALGRASGIDVGMLPETLSGGYADSALLRLFGRRMAAGVSEPRTGSVGTMRKDAELIDETARALGQPTCIASAAARAYQLAGRHDLGDLEISLLPEFYAMLARESAC